MYKSIVRCTRCDTRIPFRRGSEIKTKNPTQNVTYAFLFFCLNRNGPEKKEVEVPRRNRNRRCRYRLTLNIVPFGRRSRPNRLAVAVEINVYGSTRARRLRSGKVSFDRLEKRRASFNFIEI